MKKSNLTKARKRIAKDLQKRNTVSIENGNVKFNDYVFYKGSIHSADQLPTQKLAESRNHI